MAVNLLETGEIVSTHGIQGEVKILPWADGPEFLLDFDTFYLRGKPYEVLHARVHKTCVLAKLRGIDTPEQATALRGQVVCIDRSDVKLPEGTVFIADLIGCRAITEEGVEIGKITEVLTMPSSDVYVIQGEHKYMIPSVKEFVKEINVAQGYVRIHLIEGMATDEN
ncbi:MAG: 16S rRNA processing protein RimM [Oscillospiraceae bacterium]|nr:16S rRNA processing protein RimM [Oscillospiraceae bacterium]